MLAIWRGRSADKPTRIETGHVRAFLTCASLPMAAYDAGGLLIGTNAAWQGLLGWTEEEMRTGEIEIYLHTSDAVAFEDRVRTLLHGEGTNFAVTCRWLHRDGSTVSCLTRGFRAGDSARGTPIIIALENVSDSSLRSEHRRADETALAMQRAVATVTSSARSAPEAWSAILTAIGEHGGWDAAVFWESTANVNCLRCVHVWHAGTAQGETFIAGMRNATLARGVGAPGQAWDLGRPLWHSHLSETERSPHTAKADVAGLHTAVCIPVLVRGVLIGVLDLTSQERREENATILQALTDICRQIGNMIERIEHEEPVRHEATHYQCIAEMASEAIITIDPDSVIQFSNGATERMFGYTRAELQGQPLTILMPAHFHGPHLAGVRRYFDSGERRIQWENLEFSAVHRSGAEILVRMTFADISQGSKRLLTGFLRDVTQQKQEESALLYQALHDALTGLPNRTLLQDRLDRAVLVSHRHNLPLSLLFMDLDRFKDVNDTFGHHCGDELLKHVADRLGDTLRESDTVARLGGDEFAILLPSTDERGSSLTARRILQIFGTPFNIEGRTFEIGASIGIAHYPHHGDDTVTLMRRADVAMYAAKRAASGFAIYSSERDEFSSQRLLLTNELRQAIDTDQLRLHFQPKVDLRTGRTENVEALVRWQHPQRGFMPPDTFIPIAEESGLIKPLTVWVLNEGLRQHCLWREEGHLIRVAVNFSARMLHDPELLDIVSTMLQTWKVDPSSLEIEITESAIMVDQNRARETLTALHTAGILTSIDDFGTGHSSLAYLRQLPFDEIKIDKSFVLDMATNRDDAAIVRSVVALAHNFELQVVAEGVDNQRTLDMLRKMGCDIAQGYYLSRPVPAADLSAWLRSTPTALSTASGSLEVRVHEP